MVSATAGNTHPDGMVVVLTFPHAGAAGLRAELTAHPSLGCTGGTGLLPLAYQAYMSWQRAEGRVDPAVSPLAARSVRGMMTALVMTILARAGKPRLCEVSVAPVHCADAFLKFFPRTRFLCMYRSCEDVIRATIDEHPPGAHANEFPAHPTDDLVALAEYWLVRSSALAEFEESHQESCLRVRYEDLATQREATLKDVFAFLGLATDEVAVSGPGEALVSGFGTGPTGELPHQAAPLPLDHIPPPLLAQANALLSRLGYSAWAPPVR